MELFLSKIQIILSFVIFLSLPIFSQTLKNDFDWKSFHFLLGEWTGEGSGVPGQGIGSFSFEFDLQKKIIVRKGSTSFSSTKDSKTYVHDDLTIIYKKSDGTVDAIYFDNESHIISYNLYLSDDRNEVTFLSNYAPNSPRYRITYSKINNQKLKVKFEMASASNPDAFSVYYSGTVHRK